MDNIHPSYKRHYNNLLPEVIYRVDTDKPLTDIVDPVVRSQMMAGIRGKNTKIELVVRKALFAKGLRYRIHAKRLPGKPDLVFPRYKAVIFIHGCFWHGHSCHLFRIPATRTEFWTSKILGNQTRDQKHLAQLKEMGWKSLTLWECSLRGKQACNLGIIVDFIIAWLKNGEGIAEFSGNMPKPFQ